MPRKLAKKSVRKSKKRKAVASKPRKKAKVKSERFELTMKSEEAPKGRVEITIRKKVLGEAPEEYHFVVADGSKLKSIYELVDALGMMEEDIFRHHVNEFKNDFSNWIRDVFEEPDLAKEVAEIQDRMETERALLKHLLNELKEISGKKKKIEVPAW